MSETIPSHRKQRAAPRKCVTTYNSTEDEAEARKTAKSGGKSKTSNSEVNN